MIQGSLPDSYFLAVLITLCATIYGALNFRRTWAPPFLVVVGTFAAWYLVEPIYTPSSFDGFQPKYIETAYGAATLFIGAFIAFFFGLGRSFRPPGVHPCRSIHATLFAPGAITPDRLAKIAIGLWLVLLVYGSSRMGWDVIAALFPIEGRAGVSMWQRYAGASAGPTGFIVSMAAYLYTLVLASLGILLTIVRKPSTRLLLLIVILIAWPYAFLQGSRNVSLAVTAPMFAGLFLFTRIKMPIKLAILAAGFVAIEFAFRVVIAMRVTQSGLTAALAVADLEGQRHLGLNMGSELVWIAMLLDQGSLAPSWGSRYLAEVVMIVPRAIWPGKPLLGIDYAVARGFGGANSDIGVSATISSGMIGQGALNFGMTLGPIVAGFLLAVWANLLHRLRLQGTAPRIALFLVGLGLTFNLGRDITLLVLFPFVFGYVAVRFIEKRQSRGSQARMRRRRYAPRYGPPHHGPARRLPRSPAQGPQP